MDILKSFFSSLAICYLLWLSTCIQENSKPLARAYGKNLSHFQQHKEAQGTTT